MCQDRRMGIQGKGSLALGIASLRSQRDHDGKNIDGVWSQCGQVPDDQLPPLSPLHFPDLNKIPELWHNWGWGGNSGSHTKGIS